MWHRRASHLPGPARRPPAHPARRRHSRLFNSNGSLARALEVCRAETMLYSHHCWPHLSLASCRCALCGINDDFFHGLLNHTILFPAAHSSVVCSIRRLYPDMDSLQLEVSLHNYPLVNKVNINGQRRLRLPQFGVQKMKYRMIRPVEHRRKFKDRFGANCTIYHFGKQRTATTGRRTEGSRTCVRWSACSLMDGGDSISIALVNPAVIYEVLSPPGV